MIIATLPQPPIRVADSWQHQLEAYHFAVGTPATLLAMAMGTGKSKVAIDLAVNWGAKKILVLCPTSVRAVWRREFARWAEDRFVVEVLDRGTVAKRTVQAGRAMRRAEANNKPFVAVVNYESAWRKPFGDWALGHSWDLVIADESHRAKAHNTQISKWMMKLADKARRRLCLTGTPLPHSPLDVFGQYRFLDWRIFGRRWLPFKHRYGIPHPHIQNALLPNRFQNLDELQERFGRIAYQVGVDVLDLPPVMHDTRPFTLPTTAARIYRDLEQEFCAEVEGGFVTAANVLVKSIRLRQCVSGFVQPDEGEAVVDIHDGKAELLADLLYDLREPVVVFAEFRHDLAAIRRITERLYLRYGEVSGRANDLTDDATMPGDIDVLGVQYQSGGVGIDLTRARVAVYYSPTYSMGNYEQSMARLNRPGQTRPVTYYHLVAEGTIDEAVYKALEKKKDIVSTILDAAKRRTTCR